jgi:MurNAc alpha-1-phosphate uridylyltransferase
MILAAGRGERMRPLTDHTPKPLLPVAGKPLIVWHLERLAQAGYRDIVINHAWLPGQIERLLGNGATWGTNIHYSAEPPDALETAGGIANALSLLGAEPFLVINGDIWSDFACTALPQLAAGDLAHLVLVPNPPHHPHGDFDLRNGRIGITPRFTFSGIGLYRPELFAEIERGKPAPLAPLLRAALAVERVSGQLYTGQWLDVGTPARLAALDAEVRTRLRL